MKSAMDAAHQGRHRPDRDEDPEQKARFATENEADLKLGGHFIQRGFTQQQAKIKAVWENPQIASLCSQMPNLTVLQSNIAAALDKTSLTSADHAALREYAEATAVAALRRLRAIFAKPHPAIKCRWADVNARAHVSPQATATRNWHGRYSAQLPEAAPAGPGRLRLFGGGTGVSAWPAPLRNGCGRAGELVA